MPHPLIAYAEVARQTARAAAYFGLSEITRSITRRETKDVPRYVPERPLPSQRELLAEIWALIRRDGELVHLGLCPPFAVEEGDPLAWLGRVREMLADLPVNVRRYRERQGQEVRAELADTDGLPDYYLQNFHFQSGGYLTEQSARLYDVQVETLFMGTASLMRRQALRPIADQLRGRDQRTLHLADIACGTGRFIGQLLQVYPRLNVTGIDLSAEYLEEARRHLGERSSLHFLQGNAEALPLGSASQDIATSIFLYHELPGPVRRRVTTEIARVLKPGGIFILVDSLQWGDKRAYDGLLETFPVRFHEPYFRGYLDEDLPGMLREAGLGLEHASTPFLSKIMVARKSRAAGSR